MQDLIDCAQRSLAQLEAESALLDPLAEAISATGGAQGEVCGLDVDHMDINGLSGLLRKAEKNKTSTMLSARGVAMLEFARLVLGMRRAVKVQDLHGLQDFLIKFRSFNNNNNTNSEGVCKVSSSYIARLWTPFGGC
jgi:hypothetical protein